MLNSTGSAYPRPENSEELNDLLLDDTINAIFGGRDPSSGESDENFLPDIANLYLPPYPNPSRYPTVFQNASNSSTFEVLFQFTPTFPNLMILICLVSCTVWVIVMNMMIIGALLKGHKYDKEHVTDMYLINLLFADVLLGVFVFPFMSIVILIGYFPLSATWCNIWVYFDYYLIIASSYGFAALMFSYFMILRWPEYYPRSRRLHSVFICFIWVISNAPWTAPFINDRLSVLYPKGVCGFSIKENRYFTIYIGFTGFYIPLAIALVAGIFTVKYLKQSVRVPFIRLILNSANSSRIHPFVPTSADTESTEVRFNDLYQARRQNRGNTQVHFNYICPHPPRQGLSSSDMPSESTGRSSSPLQKKRYSIISVKTFERNQALQDSVRRHFRLVATSLILFVLSRNLFYTYFGIGSVVPKLFPPDLSHSVYWVMHSYAVAAPIVHLLLDCDLRRSVIRFISEGTFELPPPDSASMTTDKARLAKLHQMQHAMPKVSVIGAPRYQNHQHQIYCNGNGNGNVYPYPYPNKMPMIDRGYQQKEWYYA